MLNIKNFLNILFISFGLLGFSQTPSIQWQKCYGGNANEYMNSIVQTSDGGYVMAGYTASTNGDITTNFGGDDFWVIKVDYLGNIQWQKTYGGQAGDQANSIQQTTDGGYIVVGYNYSYNGDTSGNHGGQDFWVLKISNIGSVEWQKAYGGDDNEVAYSVKQTTDGGYIIAGHTYSYDGVIMLVNGDVTNFHGGIDAWIIKINSSGTLEWQKTIGGSGNEEVFEVQQTTDGGYIAAGEHGIAYWLIKLNNAGDIQWENTYANCDSAYSVKQTTDGGYIIAGDALNSLYSYTSHNFGIIKVNSIGVTEWRHDYGGNGFFDYAESIILEPDGGYVIAGTTNSYYSGDLGNTNGGQDYWIIKINSTGVIQWKKAIGGSNDEVATEIQRTTDGGYIVSGGTHSTNGNVTGFHGGYHDAWIVKLGIGALNDNDILTKSEFFVYPNPTKDIITIENSKDLKIEKIVINDILGKSVLETNSNSYINISNFESGIYFVKIYSDNVVYTKKIIKQ